LYIQGIQVGMLGTNCYLVACPETKEAIVIDPGDEGKRIFNLVTKNGFKVTGIVNTHGHFDHIGGNEYLKQKTGAKLYIHADDAEMLTEPEKNLSSLFDPGSLIISPPADIILHDGDRMEIGAHVFYVIHKPVYNHFVGIKYNKNITAGLVIITFQFGKIIDKVCMCFLLSINFRVADLFHVCFFISKVLLCILI